MNGCVPRRYVLAGALILPLLAMFALGGCGPKSDEELIENRVQEFVSAYNAGDLEGVIACADTQSRMFIKGMAGLLGVATGEDINSLMVDLFGISSSVAIDGKLLTVNSIDIQMDSQERAKVNASICYKDYQQQVEDVLRLVMVKEKGDWYICFM